MASKYERITDLYLQTAGEVATQENWPRFLTTACYNFRLSFDKQILLYAQRPDATAVLPIEGRQGWNHRFGRWVNRGSKGIAILDSDSNGQARIQYFFDIADTHEGRHPRPVPIWTVRPEQEQAIMETLVNSFGVLGNTNTLGDALLLAASNAMEDNFQDYLAQLIYYKEGSFLEPLDEESLETIFKPLLQNSIGYMLLVRCGIDSGAYFQWEDFSYIKLIALHDLDCPWRPSDLAQRLGRIVRQGNQNPEVEIFRYVTESTFDSYLYQLVENKQKFIAQIMTSKAPARIADDVDETALSYSEIKALATGNPLIIEKCNLDVEVSKLNMLKVNHLNQRFALENLVLRKYPADIAKLTEAIAGYEKDVATAQAHPKPAEGFIGMEIMGTHYSEKEAAGKAVINACTTLQGSDSVPLGQYRGFSMSLQYDAAHTDYKLTMKGAMSHTISLGADIFGNITRMDNLVDGMAKELERYRTALQDTHTQLANAKAEMETPFAKEAELAEKSARLKELNILLNMDQKDTALLDEAPEKESHDGRKTHCIER